MESDNAPYPFALLAQVPPWDAGKLSRAVAASIFLQRVTPLKRLTKGDSPQTPPLKRPSNAPQTEKMANPLMREMRLE